MEGDPALVVRLVDAGSVLHQESHHVHIVVYTCLREKGSKVRKLYVVSLGCFDCTKLPHASRTAGKFMQFSPKCIKVTNANTVYIFSMSNKLSEK